MVPERRVQWFGADQRADTLSSEIDCRSCRVAKNVVDTVSVTKICRHVTQNDRRHARIYWCSRVVVEIDRRRHTVSSVHPLLTPPLRRQAPQQRETEPVRR